MRSVMLAVVLAASLPAGVSADTASSYFKDGKSYCYFDEHRLVWRLGNASVERTIEFDRGAGALRTTRVTAKGGAPTAAPAPGLEGQFVVTSPGEAGSATTVRLSGDWAYAWQVVNRFDTNRTLTIHLQGIRKNSGYEVEARYTIYGGDRPYLGKSFTLVNRTGATRVITEVVYDDWILTAAPKARRTKAPSVSAPAVFKNGPEGSGILSSAEMGAGMLVAVPGAAGGVTRRDGAVRQSIRPNAEVNGSGGRYTAPLAVTAAYAGPPETGAFLYQVFVGAVQKASR